MLKTYDTKLYATFGEKKAACVERFNHTLKTKMWREFTARVSYKWIDILDNLVCKYNHSKHRAVGLKPNKVTVQHEPVLREIHDRNNANQKPGVVWFKENDCVQGCFYNDKLKKAAHKDKYLVDKIVKRQSDQVLVKWYGFPSSENTRENVRDINL